MEKKISNYKSMEELPVDLYKIEQRKFLRPKEYDTTQKKVLHKEMKNAGNGRNEGKGNIIF